MARAWEPEFIRLWKSGATHPQLAQALGIPLGTVKPRAHTLISLKSTPGGPAGPASHGR
jgi:hypothetical protein